MKKIAIFTMLFFCFAVTICQAASNNEFALGGITLGMSKNAVKNIYGEPKQLEDKHNRDICMYGDSFVLHFFDGYKSIYWRWFIGLLIIAGRLLCFV